MPTGAEIVADHDPAPRGRPDASRLAGIGCDRIDRRSCVAQAGIAPGAPPIVADHRQAVDYGRQNVGRSRDRRQRRHLADLSESGHDRIGAAAVLTREKFPPAEQIETMVRRPSDQRPRRNRGPWDLSTPPTVLVATKHAVGCRTNGQLAVWREGERKDRADDELTRLRRPAPPSIARTQDSES